MPQLVDIPAIKEGDIAEGQCGLDITALEPALSLAAAWDLLPTQGKGWVMLADCIRRFDPALRQGLLLEAEVVDGQTTVVLRSDGTSWRAWRWTETTGQTHRYFERAYLSSESRDGGQLKYRHYWTLKPEDDDVQVWQPVGARFIGFEEA